MPIIDLSKIAFDLTFLKNFQTHPYVIVYHKLADERLECTFWNDKNSLMMILWQYITEVEGWCANSETYQRISLHTPFSYIINIGEWRSFILFCFPTSVKNYHTLGMNKVKYPIKQIIFLLDYQKNVVWSFHEHYPCSFIHRLFLIMMLLELQDTYWDKGVEV